MTRPHTRLPARQQGAVLVVSLVMLVVLTLLGVSVMNMTQLQERMAGNQQEDTQAFQSAETGLSAGFSDDAAWNPTPGFSVNGTVASVSANNNDGINGSNATVIPNAVGRQNETTYRTQYLSSTNPPTGYDVAQFRRAHFDFESNGTTQSGFSYVLHGGGAQVFRSSGFVD